MELWQQSKGIKDVPHVPKPDGSGPGWPARPAGQQANCNNLDL